MINLAHVVARKEIKKERKKERQADIGTVPKSTSDAKQQVSFYSLDISVFLYDFLSLSLETLKQSTSFKFQKNTKKKKLEIKNPTENVSRNMALLVFFLFCCCFYLVLFNDGRDLPSQDLAISGVGIDLTASVLQLTEKYQFRFQLINTRFNQQVFPSISNSIDIHSLFLHYNMIY